MSYLKLIFLLGIPLQMAKASPLSSCGRYLTIEEKLIRFRQLEMPIDGKPLSLLREWEVESRENLVNPNPKFFLSDEEIEEYERLFKSYKEDKDFALKNPLFPTYYLFHFLLSPQEERSLLEIYRRVRNHDLIAGRVEPLETQKKSELLELPKNAFENLSEEIDLSPGQWQLLEKYHVPLPGCKAPLSVQVGKILLQHNLRFLYKHFKRLSIIERRPDILFDFFEETGREFERYLALFPLEKNIRLTTYMHSRVRRTIQYVLQNDSATYLPGNYWNFYSVWSRATEFTEKKLGHFLVIPEEVYIEYPNFLEEYLKRTQKNSDVPILDLVKQRLVRENYEDKEKFLKMRIHVFREFERLSMVGSLNTVSSRTDDEILNLITSPAQGRHHQKEELQRFADTVNSSSVLKPKEKMVVKLLNGFFKREDIFLLLKNRFSGQLSKPELQSWWLKLFIPEYYKKRAKKLNWPLVFSTEEEKAFEEILEKGWSVSDSGQTPFDEIFLLLEQRIIPKCDALPLEAFSQGSFEWKQLHLSLTERATGILIGLTRERVRQIRKKAYEKLARVLTPKSKNQE